MQLRFIERLLIFLVGLAFLIGSYFAGINLIPGLKNTGFLGFIVLTMLGIGIITAILSILFLICMSIRWLIKGE